MKYMKISTKAAVYVLSFILSIIALPLCLL